MYKNSKKKEGLVISWKSLNRKQWSVIENDICDYKSNYEHIY